jgi:hypothetical protein
MVLWRTKNMEGLRRREASYAANSSPMDIDRSDAGVQTLMK